MKKVVDSSALRSPILASYLSASPTNMAIVTENLWMELFKGDGATNVEHSLRTLAAYPKQVLVLKSLSAILKLRPRETGLHARLVDLEQTDGFGRYCRALFSNRWTEEEAKWDRERKQALANRKYQRGLQTVETIRATIEELKKRLHSRGVEGIAPKETHADGILVSFFRLRVRHGRGLCPGPGGGTGDR